jgi:hypothetical protein
MKKLALIAASVAVLATSSAFAMPGSNALPRTTPVQSETPTQAAHNSAQLDAYDMYRGAPFVGGEPDANVKYYYANRGY